METAAGKKECGGGGSLSIGRGRGASEYEMGGGIFSEPLVRFTPFNFCLEALHFYFLPTITTGASGPTGRHNSADAGCYRKPCPPPHLFN